MSLRYITARKMSQTDKRTTVDEFFLILATYPNTAVAYESSSKLFVIVVVNNAALSQVTSSARVCLRRLVGRSGAFVSRGKPPMASQFRDTHLNGLRFSESETFPIMTFEVLNVVFL
ncbi:hypothetical protein HMN09_00382200 [Mycena chlorophos]|uniref:Uncharacterized protein n=1 Tax=Mycena chlorophos TaxID=658473 RepID=A0A8H6WHD5_MYCCL|nr:hypothetical protein HMN09_00382200 [Mycena chlorophos]